ncbi:MAG: hypothetical protein PHR57_01790 [Patescibacteria group bacterium]|nr:hypothetical protein [Patescibacteria group bacterium]
MKIKKILSALFIFSFLLAFPFAVKAETKLQIIKNEGAYENGNYQLTDVQAMVVEFSNIILQIVGVLTFAMFIYGGVLFLTSAGNPNTVKNAKKIIVAAIVGLIIVFVSYTAVQFFIGTIAPSDSPYLMKG